MVDPLYYAQNTEACLAANRRYIASDKGKAARARATKAYRERNRQRLDAHNAVAYALKTGRISKLPCEVCGLADVEAHHPDYSRPLLVTWLCSPHHKQVHNETRQ